MAVTKRLRFEVLRRDEHTCRYCGASAPDATLTVDHVVPVALGGADDPSNLVAACRDCNAGKASSSPDSNVVEDVAADAFRWAAAMKRAAELQASRRSVADGYYRAFDEAWSKWHVDDAGRCVPLPGNYEQSLSGFYKADLEIEQVIESISVAMEQSSVNVHSKFRYMCGVCWNVIKERREIASQLLAEEAMQEAA